MKDPYYDSADDEGWDDDEYNYYPDPNSNDKPYEFKFDMAAWEEWLKNVINDIIEKDGTWSFKVDKNEESPVNDSTDSAELDNNLVLYFGQNLHNEPIWKVAYFIHKEFDIEYKNHFASNASHIIKQPHYYRSMFDILN